MSQPILTGGPRMRPAAARPELANLVSEVRAVIDKHTGWGETSALVADALRRNMPRPNLLTAEEQAGDPRSYQSHLLYAEPDGTFSIVAVVWRPRQVTPIHDHITWCVVGVMQGVEQEELFTSPTGDYLARAGDNVNPQDRSLASRRPATSTGCTTPPRARRSRCTFTAPTSPGSAPAFAVNTTSPSALTDPGSWIRRVAGPLPPGRQPPRHRADRYVLRACKNAKNPDTIDRRRCIVAADIPPGSTRRVVFGVL